MSKIYKLLFLFIFFISSPSLKAIEIEDVDAPQYFEEASNRSIALDPDGYPHIVYGGDYLYYTYYNGSSWKQETVDENPGLGASASLVIGSDGVSHIVYRGDRSSCWYATNKSGEWEIQELEEHCYDPILTRDTSGTLHLTYSTYNNSSSSEDELLVIKHDTSSDGETWDSEEIETGPSLYNPSFSMAVDNSGGVHICYYTEDGLKYAEKSSGGLWSTEVIEAVSGSGNPTSLAVDSSGKVYIAYYDSSNGDLKYAKGSKGSWAVTKVDGASTSVGKYLSLAVSSTKNVSIVYWSSTDDTWKYALYKSGFWSLSDIDLGSSEEGFYSSIVLDASGNPSIVLGTSNSSNLSLFYGYKNGSSAWDLDVLEQGRDVGSYCSLKLDPSTQIPYIAYEDTTDSSLFLAIKKSGVWTTDKVVLNGEYPFIDIASDKTLHLSYLVSNTLMYQKRSSSGTWGAAETIASKVGYHSLVVDSSGVSHVAYYKSDTYDLMYAKKSGSSWVSESVDTDGSVGLYPAIDVDSTGNVYVCYKDSTNSDLKCATRSSSTGLWTLEKVDGDGFDVYSSISVDVSSSGRLHVAYRDDTNSLLKYSVKEESHWTTEIVDEENQCIINFSLKVAEDESVHIGCTRGVYDISLAYAKKEGNEWKISIFEDKNQATYGSLDVDNSGEVHLSYYDSHLYDLKYVSFNPDEIEYEEEEEEATTGGGSSSGGGSATGGAASVSEDAGGGCSLRVD